MLANIPGGLGKINKNESPSVLGCLCKVLDQARPAHPIFTKNNYIIPRLQGLFHPPYFFVSTYKIHPHILAAADRFGGTLAHGM
jgi:hypothetical protein